MSLQSSTPKYICRSKYVTCTGHFAVPDPSIYPSSAADVLHSITLWANTNRLFEKINATYFQLRNAQIENSCFKMPNNFCVPSFAGQLVVDSLIPIIECQMQKRLVMFYISKEAKKTATKDLEERLDDLEQNYYLKFPVGINFVSEEELALVRPYLTEEEIDYVTKVENGTTTFIGERTARKIVYIMHTSPIFNACMKVKEIAASPPGILPLITSYLPSPLDDLPPL